MDDRPEVRKPYPSEEDLNNWFTYHKPKDEDVDKYIDIRNGGLAFATVILKKCPDGPDKTVAIRKIREAVMTANASIACCGKP